MSRRLRPPEEPIRQERQQPELTLFPQLAPVGDVHAAFRVLGTDDDALVAARFDARTGAEADGRVERLRAGMEQIQGPDVDGPTCQVDARWRRGVDVHSGIIVSCRAGFMADATGSGLRTRVPIFLHGRARLAKGTRIRTRAPSPQPPACRVNANA